MTTTHLPRYVALCTCDARPKSHLAAVQRILIAGAPEADPQLVRRALDDVHYDLSVLYGSDVLMVVTFREGDETGTVAAARAWAAENGVAEESGAMSFNANLIFTDPADQPAWGSAARPAGPPSSTARPDGSAGGEVEGSQSLGRAVGTAPLGWRAGRRPRRLARFVPAARPSARRRPSGVGPASPASRVAPVVPDASGPRRPGERPGRRPFPARRSGRILVI
ncbi:hypothetical protein ID875_20960 [Streptomyces globisporus]|uniref:Uncharacterized protein n=1 Tax=Streptomyces globisporus TaxID=1908 RepID=A0A927BN97_STRGL|nr:hypothetical protein [Streptomyces globisporus]